MRKSISCILLFLFLNIFPLFSKIIVFYAPDCEDCYHILTDSLFESLGYKTMVFYDINNINNYELLLKAEEIYNKRSTRFPVILSGKELFYGDEVIPNLPVIRKVANESSLPDSILKKGMSEKKPRWEDAAALQPFINKETRNIYIAFFTKPGCIKCDRTAKMIEYLERKYKFLRVKTYDTMDRENQKAQEAMSIAFDVPENERLIAPTIFICDTFLIEKQIMERNLELLITENKDRNFPPPWDNVTQYENVLDEQIIERFKKFGSFVVFLAGLVDGINPCAFATIVFFLSFMTIIGRTKREIIATGITFISVLFIVYFLIGVFLYKILGIKFFVSLRHFLYYIIAAISFVLAGISVLDAVMLAKGKPERSILKLPKVIKRRMERTIIKQSKLRNYIITALISAVVISFLEFSCTGQIYIPTIFFVSGISSLRFKALWFLVLYNLAFIVPIFLLFLFFIIGLSSERLYAFMRRRAFLLKIATALIFLILAISLILIR